MNIFFSTLKKIWFWAYERGTWQYDLLCVLILMAIFFTPNVSIVKTRIFTVRASKPPVYLTAEELGPASPDQVKHIAETILSERRGYPVTIFRIEVSTDESSRVTSCLAWER